MVKTEYLVAVLIGFIALLLTSGYFLFGLIDYKSDLVYLGRRVVNSNDTFTYVAFIEQAKQGHLLFANLYTSEPQQATIIRPSYALLGIVASLFGYSSLIVYHLGRVLFSIVFFVVLYVFLMEFFKTPKKRLLAFTVVLSSSGFGYLLEKVFPQTSDIWIPESITFLSMQEAPHFILSQTLMLLSFMFILKAYKSEKLRYISYSFVVLLLLSFEHPYNLLICALTTIFFSIYLWVRKKVKRRVLLIGAGSVVLNFLLGFSYQYFEIVRNPILGSWAAESSSPTPLHYLLGFGLIIVFGLFGLEVYLRERKIAQVLIVSWIAATAILMYSPVFFQRRLSEGIHIPLAIAAAEGIIVFSLLLSSFVLHKAKKAVSYTVACILVVLLSLGSISVVWTDIATVTKDSKEAYYYYVLSDEIRGMTWLRENTDQSDIILSNFFYGNIIPGVSGRRVHIGHRAQTKNFNTKIQEVNTQFLVNKNTSETYKFLKDRNITYIFVGKNDTMLRYGFKPAEKPYLEKVFDEGEVKIYKVK